LGGAIVLASELVLGLAGFGRATPYDGELPRLTALERALYDDIRQNRLGELVRLEQERIPFGWLLRALQGTDRDGY
jgi:hypothetical protein